MSEGLKLSEYPLRSGEKLRYADTDRLGHINNTVFPMLFETGHAELFYGDRAPRREPGCFFVIVRFIIEFVGETYWPGSVDIGTRVTRLGQSSVELDQAMFQDERCVATAKSVIVSYDDGSRRSRPLSPTILQYFSLFETQNAVTHDKSERDKSERDKSERDKSERDKSERDKSERDKSERDKSERV